MNYVLEEKK